MRQARGAGALLRALRKEAGLTQEALAWEAACHLSVVSLLEGQPETRCAFSREVVLGVAGALYRRLPLQAGKSQKVEAWVLAAGYLPPRYDIPEALDSIGQAFVDRRAPHMAELVWRATRLSRPAQRRLARALRATISQPRRRS